MSHVNKQGANLSLKQSKLSVEKKTSKMGVITIMNKCDHPTVILSSRVCLGETHVITGAMDGISRLYQIKEGALVRQYKDEDLVTRPASVTGIALQKNYQYTTSFVASYSEGYLKYWNIQNGNCIRTINEERQILGLVQNPHDNKYLSLGSDGIMYYYDTETGHKIRSFMNSQTNKMEGHTSRVYGAAFHPKNIQEFVSGGWDNTVLYWDMRKPISVKGIMGPHICGDGIDINPTGHLIMTCSYDTNNPLKFYEYGTGKNYLNLEYNQNKLYCGKWIAPMFVATGSSDPSILNILDMYSIRVVSYYKTSDTGVYSMDHIDLNMKKKNRKDEDLYSVLVFTAGKSLTIIKVEFTHK